jgi:beta-N-acetylhexosaminidase
MLGFNLNLAPVLDFNPFDERDNSLGGRCWGTNPSETIEKASAFLRGMQKHGVKGTGKHFPGYTFCEKDPHGDLPIIRRTEQQIQEEELAVFRAFVPLAEAMMIGHAHFPAWHEEPFPASLSPRIVQTMLREQMGYQGLIMTDDLEMGAIANRFGMEETTRLAIEAGEDALLICHNPACVEIAFDTLNSMPVEKVQRAMNSVSSFCQSLLAPPQSFNLDAFNQVNAEMKELRERVRR